MLSQISAVFTAAAARRHLQRGLSTRVALCRDERRVLDRWYGWLLALLFYDFCYYWLHRAGHESAVFWAAHVVHHQSQDYNLSTALRQTSSGALLGWLFYLPMALAGVPPLVFGVVALIDLLYQFWVHTEQVGQAGLVRPLVLLALQPSRAPRGERPLPRSQLRRHPDRLGPPVRQLRGRRTSAACTAPAARCDSWDPLWSNAEVYWALAQDSWHARRWLDKLRVWFKPPGWRPADVAARFPKPAFDIAQGAALTTRRSAAAIAWFGAMQFALLLPAWRCSCGMRTGCRSSQSAVWLAALAAGLWAVGRSDAGAAARCWKCCWSRPRRIGHGHRRCGPDAMASGLQAAGDAAGDLLRGRSAAPAPHGRPGSTRC